MRELVQVVFSYVCLKIEEFGIEFDFYEKYDIYIYVFEGVVFKDGLLVGIMMVIVFVFVLMGCVVLCEVGMIGEIMFCGCVLLIGGLKEKVFGVYRVGLMIIIVFKENEKDIEDIFESVREGFIFILVFYLDEVLEYVLVGEKK